jgi:hypothetical protein
MTSISENMSSIVAQATAITEQANLSLDRYERKVGRLSRREEIFEMGILLAGIRHSRSQATALSKIIPSPNRVPHEYAKAYAEIANALFGFIESCERREDSIGKMALGFRCETAV